MSIDLKWHPAAVGSYAWRSALPYLARCVIYLSLRALKFPLTVLCLLFMYECSTVYNCAFKIRVRLSISGIISFFFGFRAFNDSSNASFSSFSLPHNEAQDFSREMLQWYEEHPSHATPAPPLHLPGDSSTLVWRLPHPLTVSLPLASTQTDAAVFVNISMQCLASI